MHLHSFQHTPSETLGEIETWARRKGHLLSATRFYLGERPPALESVEWLVILGGPMNIYEYRNHPWLVAEKQFIAQALAGGKTVLGICLGAQLIADALGGKVFQNPEIEIGWAPVHFNKSAVTHPAFADFPETLTPLHWHGDTFSLPPGVVNVAASTACKHQAFAVGEKVVGLQFHLEVGQREVAAFLEGEEGGFGSGPFIQSADEIRQGAAAHLPTAHAALESLLNALEEATLRDRR